MVLLPEELHNYSLCGLTAMADLLTEVETRASNYPLPVEFLQSLDELRGDIDREIDAGLEAIDAFEARVMTRVIQVLVRRKISRSKCSARSDHTSGGKSLR